MSGLIVRLVRLSCGLGCIEECLECLYFVCWLYIVNSTGFDNCVSPQDTFVNSGDQTLGSPFLFIIGIAIPVPKSVKNVSFSLADIWSTEALFLAPVIVS